MSALINVSRAQQAFTKAAPHYNHHAQFQRDAADKLIANVQLKSSDIIVDLACGTGYCGDWLSHPHTIYLDIAPTMLQQTAQSKMICADMMALPLQSHSLDMIISNLGLHWAGHFEQALMECHRALKHGGKLLFSVPGPGTLRELQTAFAKEDAYTHIHPPITTSQLKDALHAFKNVTIQQHSFVYHYTSFQALLNHLKNTGVSNAHPAQRQSLSTPALFKKVGEHYADLYGFPLPTTFEVLYVSAEA